MYTRRKRFEWIAWEKPEGWADGDPDYSGFRARILANPTAGDVNHESELFGQIARNMRDQSLVDAYAEALAERVPEWEYAEEDENGDVVPVPAPGEGAGNWQAFYLLDPGLFWWLIGQIRGAHLPKATTRASQNVLTTVPEIPNTNTPDPAPPTS